MDFHQTTVMISDSTCSTASGQKIRYHLERGLSMEPSDECGVQLCWTMDHSIEEGQENCKAEKVFVRIEIRA